MIVVTVPLGVLPARSIGFQPQLPVSTAAAIDSLVMGFLDEFWFRFDQVVWRDDALMSTWVDPGDNPFTEWFNLEPVAGESLKSDGSRGLTTSKVQKPPFSRCANPRFSR